MRRLSTRQPELLAAVAERRPLILSPGRSAPVSSESAGRRSRLRLDPLELLMLIVLAALSMWVVALNLWLAAKHGLVWTGIDGELPVDEMQYLAWVQDASRHVLASNLFVLPSTPHDYLQPMVAISGGLTAAGVAPWLALLLWKPVALIAIFFAVRAYCRRALAGRWERLVAIALGLFAAFWGTLGDEWIPFLSWGYLFSVVALAAMIAALVAYDRTERDGRLRWLAPALGLLAAWLHPWEGELLILLVIGVELARRRSVKRSLLLPASTIALTVLPLVYYAVLEHADPFWRLWETVTKHQHSSLSGAVLPLAPLILAAAPAYLKPPRGFIGLTARLWPIAALFLWLITAAGVGATPLHAWTGITVPLGVLAVEGVQLAGFGRLPARRWVAVLCVAFLTIPGAYLFLKDAEHFIAPSTRNQNLIAPSEQGALRYLADDPQAGGVLSDYRLGDPVPGETGRHTFAGDYRWSGLLFTTREQLAWKLLHGGLRGSAARRFVLGSGARFVLAACGAHANLLQTLAPLKLTVHRFGCAAVYVVQ